MAALAPPVCDFGWKAVDFDLADPNGERYALADVRGPGGLLVMFICNHCPYVRAIAGRIARDARDLQAEGIGVVAIMSNDYRRYPDDAPARMLDFARAHGFNFPYLIDETQSVAAAYGAVCTPDFFGFNADLALQYRGRLDDSRTEPRVGARRELFEAMSAVAATGRGPADQTPSIGCSIKWRDD
jgi:peroxiredoxin